MFKTALPDQRFASQAPRSSNQVGRPWYAFPAQNENKWKSNVELGDVALPLPSWMPEIHRAQARDPLDNTRSAMVRDLYGNKNELADWHNKLQTHLASFQKEIKSGSAQVFALPPLSTYR